MELLPDRILNPAQYRIYADSGKEPLRRKGFQIMAVFNH